MKPCNPYIIVCIVLGILAVTQLILTSLLVSGNLISDTCTPAPVLPVLGGAGILIAPGSYPVVRPSVTQNKVIPLFWDGDASIYLVNFRVGTSNVSAAFDTGSARFVVATQALAGGAVGSYYNTSTSPTSIPVIDPRSNQPCQASIAYVSQTDVIQVYQDTVIFPRLMMDSNDLCTMQITPVLQQSNPASPLTIEKFPVGGIVQSGGQSSLNVLGMSGVMSVTKWNGQYLLPSCLTSPTPAHESALVQAFASYYETSSQDVIWSMMLGTPPFFPPSSSTSSSSATQVSGMVVFAPLVIPCITPVFTPMVSSLTNASSALSATPYRYYIVEVMYCAIGVIGSDLSTYTKLPNFPKYMMVDSGTTSVLIPGPSASSNVAALNSISPGTQAVLVLVGNVVITYGTADVVFGAQSNAVFQPMDDGTATAFSSNQDVGILGCTGLRNLYVEFNLSKNIIGFGQVNAVSAN